jgi:hypothetical protein
MAIKQIRSSSPGLSANGNAGTGSYLVTKGPMGPAPAIKAQTHPAWHPQNPNNQVRINFGARKA